ncbi:MAG: 4-hydroxy-tetrahydrodipicolinate reductase [Candidatus Methanoliparum thermophilum]|uniref:4-hydroxy-tetrahydrodipicolinate reductase n=2 Tax=Candidatus Methanoliparum TaxID=2545692 RepID=A0A520KTJ9_METT2|nr:MAG: 4-hydroxy-tetrahydrodipicolinate reductase [Candidatus Methanoliparum thermophilum]
MIKVMVGGANGKMGSQVCKSIMMEDNLELVAAVDINGVGNLIDDIEIKDASNIKDIFKYLRPDVYVDFTSPDATIRNIKIAIEKGVKNLVIGTTGFSKEQEEEIANLVTGKVTAVISPNFSIGVNVFWRIIEEAAKYLNGYDFEIVEIHHRYKKDSPSGTANKIYNILCNVTGKKVPKYGREGFSERGEEIGIHSVRLGDVVGDHTVFFGGDGERLEVTHRAHSREAFASGVIRSINWLFETKRDEKIYSMTDVLGFFR